MPPPINRQVTSFAQYSHPAPGADMTGPGSYSKSRQVAQQYAKNQTNDNLSHGYTYNEDGSMFPQGMPQLNPGEPTSKGANGRNSYGDSGVGLDNTREVLGRGYNPSYLSPLSSDGKLPAGNSIEWSGPRQQQAPGAPDRGASLNSAFVNAMNQMFGVAPEARPAQPAVGNYNSAQSQLDIMQGRKKDPTLAAAGSYNPAKISDTTNYNEPNPQSSATWWSNYQQGQKPQTPAYGAPGSALKDKLSQEQVKANQASGYGVNSNSNPSVTYGKWEAKPAYGPAPEPALPARPPSQQDNIDLANRNLGTTSPAATPMTRITGRDRNGAAAFSSKKPGAMAPYGSGW